MDKREIFSVTSTVVVVIGLALFNNLSRECSKEEEITQYIINNNNIDKGKVSINNIEENSREVFNKKVARLEEKRRNIKQVSRGEARTKPTYNTNNLTEKSNITRDRLEAKLEGTPLYDVAEDFILAEERYGVNAVFLCALSIQESGWGKSKLARNKNNLFGYGAYNSSPYSSAKGFPNKSVCIDIVSKKLVENYLTEGGKYYNGKSLNAVNTRYSLDDNGKPNKKWSSNIRLLMKQLIK